MVDGLNGTSGAATQFSPGQRVIVAVWVLVAVADIAMAERRHAAITATITNLFIFLPLKSIVVVALTQLCELYRNY